MLRLHVVRLQSIRLFSQSFVSKDVFDFYEKTEQTDSLNNRKQFQERTLKPCLSKNIVKSHLNNTYVDRYKQLSLRRRCGNTIAASEKIDQAANDRSLSFFPNGTQTVQRVTSPVAHHADDNLLDDIVNSHTKSFVVKIANLPFNATFDDVEQFFEGAHLCF